MSTTALTPEQPTRPWRGRLAAPLAGLLAAAAALAAGELVAGLVASFASPVEAVATIIVDSVPESIKSIAIQLFGASDKVALIIGTVMTVALLGLAFGALARRWLGIATFLYAAFGAVGVAATLATPIYDVPDALPSVVAAVAGMAALVLLVRPLPASPAPAVDTEASSGSRRAFLVLAGGVTVAAATMAGAGRALASRFDIGATRDAITLPSPSEPLPALPDGVELGVDGVTPFSTPMETFYRVDTALSLPQVNPSDWELTVTGMVERELRLTYEDLLRRNLREYDITLTCVSNTVGGDLVGNARWQGFPLAELLDEAGVVDGVDQIVGRSVEDYTCGFPLEAAYDRDAIVAIGMNGEPLPIERGFPARLVTPGLYGYVSATKWLTNIELTTFADFDQYWVPRGWDAEAPIKPSARIDTIESFSTVPLEPLDIGGVAWAQHRGIDAVQVSIDDGDWQDAELGEVPNVDTWRQWRYRWEDITPGQHRVAARCIDGDGETQTYERAEPFPNGASGWHSLMITVDDS